MILGHRSDGRPGLPTRFATSTLDALRGSELAMWCAVGALFVVWLVELILLARWLSHELRPCSAPWRSDVCLSWLEPRRAGAPCRAMASQPTTHRRPGTIRPHSADIVIAGKQTLKRRGIHSPNVGENSSIRSGMSHSEQPRHAHPRIVQDPRTRFRVRSLIPAPAPLASRRNQRHG